ncbi:MAG TPA: YCF48-related protein [Flavobacterium sp.]|jgi:photosystem II stability/assembly factor-like uncharacterized protein
MKYYYTLIICTIASICNAQNWDVITPFNTTNSIRDMEVTPNGTLFVIADQPQRMYKSPDGGDHWSALHLNNVTFGNPSDLYMVDDNNGYMISNLGRIYKTTDGWETSTALNYPNGPFSFEKLFFLNNNIGYVVGYRGNILVTTNGGTTWTWVTIPGTIIASGEDLTDVHFINQNIGFTSSSNGMVYKTTDQGATWTKSDLQSSNYQLEELLFINENTGFAVGPLGEVYKTVNQGVTWELTDTDMGIIYDIRQHNDILYLVGSGSTFATSSNEGTTWSTIQTVEDPEYEIGGIMSMYAVTFLGDEILVAGGGGVIYQAENPAGSAWSRFYTPISGSIPTSGLKFADESRGLMVGNGNFQSALYYTDDGGYSWDRKLLGATNVYKSIDLKSDGRGLLIGQPLYRTTTDFGQTWTSGNTIQPNTSYTDCWLKENNEFFVGTNPGTPITDGMIRHTAANTWVQFADMDQITEITFADELVGYAGAGNENFAPTLWKTIDGGVSWNQVPSWSGSTIREIQTVGPNKVYVRNISNANYVSSDSGLTWTLLMNHPTKFHFFDEMNGYGIGNETHHIYKTENGGASWEIIIPNDNSLCGMENFAWFEDRIVYSGGFFLVCILNIDGSLQVNSIANAATPKIIIYPNPTKDIMNISETVKAASLSDITGKELFSYEYVNQIDISALKTGVYFLTLITDTGVKTIRKLVKE